MISISDDKVFALTNAEFSYVFRVLDEGLLQHVYYGAPIAHAEELASHFRVDRGATSHFQGVPNLNLNDLPQEYPTFGTSDYRRPALHGVNADGNSVFTLKYVRHTVTIDKPDLDGLPSARGGESETLIIYLADPLHGLEVELFYTIYQNYGVLARSSVVRNSGKAPVDLTHIMSSTIDLPPDDYDVLHLHGTWSREFNAERTKLPMGRFEIDSARSTSSAAHNPFLAVMERGATETSGNVFASTLIYSGNFSLSVETGEFEDVRVLAGINPFNFAWHLAPNEAFYTPEALHVFTPYGLRGMSRIWHRFIQNKVSPERFRNIARPTYLNTWEAAYFDIDEAKVLTLADKAKDVGVQMLVLDDGWFEGRRDDTSSLGDWTADMARFPSGIPALAARVRAKGLKFGLWIEPEMVSPNSQLFEDHPDWALQVPERKPSLGRNQLTLDFTRKEVVDNIYDQIEALLACGDIDYVKWDMNRNMTEAGSTALPKGRQLEVPHRYMLGLYGLLRRLMEAYPDVLFETCASGGNRFDLGMLSFMPQGWISDMSDPIGRLAIINGASYLYPLDVMTAYIGPSPSHQNGRISSIKTRYNAGALCAAKGISLNSLDIDTDVDLLRELMRLAANTSGDFIGGEFTRLISDDTQICWQYITRDRRTIYVAYFHILSAPNLPFRRANLADLDPVAAYELQEDGTIYHGDTLMQHGLALPYVTCGQPQAGVRYMDRGDFASHLFVLRRKR
ncbi:alpha-galactosidase [Litorimonas sp. RW-G-Af-16]